MSMSLEHDYIGLKSSSSSSLSDDFPSMDKNSDKNIRKVLNLKATELRLGLPGSESPEGENNKENPSQLSIGLNNKTFVVSGAKRGFSVASGNWVFYGNPGFDPTFSPRGADTGKTVNASDSNQVVRDGLPHSPKPVLQDEKKTTQVAATANNGVAAAPASKAQVVGWPPIHSFRKNTMASHSAKADYGTDAKLGLECLYVKVSMDGAPYLRKVDLKTYGSYTELSSALEKMFSCFTIGQCGPHGVPSRDGLNESRLMDLLHGSEYVLTYEDKDGDWMLVGDVPWKMFADSCRKLRIMKSSEAIGLAPTAMEKCRSRN